MPLASAGSRVIGVIVVSKLGLDQFDLDDLRLLEVLAGHASVALVNAQLYETQRREAESAKALLELSREIAGGDGARPRCSTGSRRAPRGSSDPSYASVWLPDCPTGGIVPGGVGHRCPGARNGLVSWTVPAPHAVAPASSAASRPFIAESRTTRV